MNSHDVVIVGGGIVGAALACALAPRDLRVALVEREPVTPLGPADPYELRVSAITLASRNLFHNLGAWDAMKCVRVHPIEGMRIWEQEETLSFHAAEIGEACLGYIVENRLMQAVLTDRARSLGVDLVCPADVVRTEAMEDHARVALANGATLTTRLVVGADGVQSALRAQAGIAVTTHDYRQKAIVATVTTERSNEHLAYQRFLPDGPLAFLPLDAHHSSIVWSADTAHADALLATDDARFLDALQAAIGQRLGIIMEVSARAAFPLRAMHAQRYLGPRLALIGDAAHRIHPLAGQGLNLGVGDVAVLAEVILDAHTSRKDIGTERVLRRFERWRKGSNTLMLNAMNGFDWLFRAAGAIAPLRRRGLGITDRIPPIKIALMRYAAGLTGDLPPLARR